MTATGFGNAYVAQSIADLADTRVGAHRSDARRCRCSWPRACAAEGEPSCERSKSSTQARGLRSGSRLPNRRESSQHLLPLSLLTLHQITKLPVVLLLTHADLGNRLRLGGRHLPRCTRGDTALRTAHLRSGGAHRRSRTVQLGLAPGLRFPLQARVQVELRDRGAVTQCAGSISVATAVGRSPRRAT